MDDDIYEVVEYTQDELDYFYNKARNIERKNGKRLEIDELIDIAVYKLDYDFIKFLKYMKINNRIKVLERKLDFYNFLVFINEKKKIPNFSEEEVNEYEEILNNNYWKNGVLDLFDTIDKAIKDENFKIINYLTYLEDRKDDILINEKIDKRIFKVNEITEKIKNKILKKVLKEFIEVKEQNEANILLLIHKYKTDFRDIRLNNFSEEQIKILNTKFNIYYLKNRNPHDKSKTTIGFIKRRLLERANFF